jgi:flagellar protein FliJ
MAKFRFKFDTVLQQRRHAEDQCQRALAKVIRQRMILQNQLRSMQQTITRSKGDLRSGLVGRVDMDRVGHFARYSGQSTARAHAIVSKLAALEQPIAEARARLLDASRARRAMELLKERHLTEWRRQEERRESAQLDEIGVQAHARRAMAEARS